MARPRTAPVENNPPERTPKSTEDRMSPTGRGIVIAAAVIGMVVLVWLLVLVKAIVVLVIVSAVLATGLAPAVGWVERTRIRGRKLPRAVAIFVVYVLALIVVLAAISAVVVPVVTESIRFSENLPDYIRQGQRWLEGMHERYPQIPDYAGLVSRVRSQLGTAGRYAVSSAGAVLGFFGGIISAISIVVMTFYMLSSSDSMRDGLLSLVPPKRRKKTQQTMTAIASTMGGWLRAQLLLAGIIGAASTAAMMLLGVPYPFMIGVVGAIGELVPMLGPFAAAVPAIILCAFGPLWKLIAAVVFFALLAWVEGNVLAPQMMRSQVGLSPLVTLIALLVGAALLGVVGALLAVPVAAGLQALWNEAIAPAIRERGKKLG